MNSTLSQAVMTLDSDLTLLEINVSALDDHFETELTVLDDRLTTRTDRYIKYSIKVGKIN